MAVSEQLIVAGINGETLLVTTDHGDTWSPASSSTSFTQAAISPDLSLLNASATDGYLYYSLDKGQSWTSVAEVGQQWGLLAPYFSMSLVAQNTADNYSNQLVIPSTR